MSKERGRMEKGWEGGKEGGREGGREDTFREDHIMFRAQDDSPWVLQNFLPYAVVPSLPSSRSPYLHLLFLL